MTTLGFGLCTAGTPETPQIVRAVAREAEARGYSSFWVNHPGSIDGLAALALGAEETQRVDLGIGVIPLHTRSPEGIKEGVKANTLPVARLLLGVGSPNPNSLGRVRDGVAALRPLHTRLIVAALGPRMCRLAGEIADGVLFNWLTPEHARACAEEVREGAAAASRPVPKLFAFVRLAVGADGEEALRREAARYAAVPHYAINFKRMGTRPEATAIAVQSPSEIAPALARWQGAVDEVVLRPLTLADTVEENLRLVRAAQPT